MACQHSTLLCDPAAQPPQPVVVVNNIDCTTGAVQSTSYFTVDGVAWAGDASTLVDCDCACGTVCEVLCDTEFQYYFRVEGVSF